MHLASHTTTPAKTAVITSVGASSLSAIRASLGFVGITFVRMILLVVSSENKGLAALHTR